MPWGTPPPVLRLLGVREPCVRRGRYHLCDTAHNGGRPEAAFRIGEEGDEPLLGDLDGDGVEGLAAASAIKPCRHGDQRRGGGVVCYPAAAFRHQLNEAAVVLSIIYYRRTGRQEKGERKCLAAGS